MTEDRKPRFQFLVSFPISSKYILNYKENQDQISCHPGGGLPNIPHELELHGDYLSCEALFCVIFYNMFPFPKIKNGKLPMKFVWIICFLLFDYFPHNGLFLGIQRSCQYRLIFLIYVLFIIPLAPSRRNNFLFLLQTHKLSMYTYTY